MSSVKDLNVRYSTRAKRVALRVNTKEHCIDLVVPKRMPLTRAYTFAWDHQDWINEQLENMPARIAFTDGARIPVFGEKIRIDVEYDTDRKTTSIALAGSTLHVRTNKKDPSSRIARFLKEHARERLSHMAFMKARATRLHLREVSVRDTHSRWGSCSEDGNISLSWRLMFAPPHACDYVVAHEVAHLRYLDHSDRFWALCHRLSNDYARGKTWIKMHGHELYRYG